MCGVTSAWLQLEACTSSPTHSSDTVSPGERIEKKLSREFFFSHGNLEKLHCLDNNVNLYMLLPEIRSSQRY